MLTKFKIIVIIRYQKKGELKMNILKTFFWTCGYFGYWYLTVITASI